ncbi:hypothetical protein ABKW28_22430 [Nocardioides sp. 31GB23]|uniref:hypothetical protein n=1 Tax=Nocardioides sp. 31GB23 TaxID=3156065 RepID=UPI0032AFFCCB
MRFSSRPTRALCRALAAALLLVLLAGPASAGPQPVVLGAPTTGTTQDAGERRARAVLAAWDERRAAVWRRGDRDGLADLYTAGSLAGARDLRMLDAWLERGLRVRGMAVEVLALEVVHDEGRRLVLRVTDRLVGAVAVGSGVRRVLPQDRPTARALVLRRSGDGWQMASVRPLGW